MSNPALKLATEPDEAGRPKKSRDWLWLTLPVALIAACSELGYAILNTSALPVYIVHGLRLDMAVFGIIMVPFFISEAVCKGPLGMIADRIGRKPLMVIGPAMSIFTPILFISIRYHPATTEPAALIAFGFLRLLDGIGAAALWPAMFAYVGDVVREEKRAAAMGILNVTYMLGLALGMLAGGFVDDTFGPVLSGEASLRHQVAGVVHRIRQHAHGPHHFFATSVLNHPAAQIVPHVFHPARFYPSFYLASALFAVAACIALLAIHGGRREGQHDTGADAHQGAPLTWQSFVRAVRTVPGMMLVAFTTFLGIGCVMIQIKIFAMDQFHITETQVGLLVLGPSLIIGALAIPLGHLSDHWGKLRSIRLGFFLGAVGMWTIVLLYRNPLAAEFALIGAGLLLGIGFVMAFPAWMALLTEVCHKGQRGTVTGAVSTAQGVGALLGVVIGGLLYNHASRNPQLNHIAPFVASAALLSLAVVLAFVAIRPGQGRPQAGEAEECRL